MRIPLSARRLCPGPFLLQAGNRVTVLLSDGGAQSCDGVMVIPFSRKNMAQELEYLEI